MRQQSQASSDSRTRRWLLGAQVVLAVLCFARLHVDDGLGFERALAFVVLVLTASAGVRLAAALLEEKG